MSNLNQLKETPKITKQASIWDYVFRTGTLTDALKGLGVGASVYLGYNFLSNLLSNIHKTVKKGLTPPNELYVELKKNEEDEDKDKEEDEIEKYSSLIKKGTFAGGLGTILGIWAMYKLNRELEEVEKGIKMRKAYKVLENLYSDYYQKSKEEDEEENPYGHYKYSSLQKQADPIGAFYGALAILSFLAGREYVNAMLLKKNKEIEEPSIDPKLVIVRRTEEKQKKKKKNIPFTKTSAENPSTTPPPEHFEEGESMPFAARLATWMFPFVGSDIQHDLENVFKIMSLVGLGYGTYKGVKLLHEYSKLKKMEEEEKKRRGTPEIVGVIK